MADNWQKSLRVYQNKIKIKKHDETDKNFVGIPTNNTKRRKLSTREVITEPDSTLNASVDAEIYLQSTIGENYKFCFSILENENVFGDVQGEASQNSVPIGEGVTSKELRNIILFLIHKHIYIHMGASINYVVLNCNFLMVRPSRIQKLYF